MFSTLYADLPRKLVCFDPMFPKLNVGSSDTHLAAKNGGKHHRAGFWYFIWTTKLATELLLRVFRP